MNGSETSPFKRTMKYVKPYSFWLVVRIAGAAVNAAIDIFLSYMVIRLVDLSLAGDREALMNSAYMMAAGILAGIIFSWINKYASGRVAIFAGRDMKRDLAAHIGVLKTDTMDKQHTGDIMSVMNNDIGLAESFLGDILPAMIFQPLRLAGAIAFLLYINWKLLVFSIIILPAALLIANRLSKPMAAFFEEMQHSLGKMNTVLQDIIGGIYVMKSFNLEEVLFGKFRKEVKEVLGKALSIEKRSSMIAPVSIIIQIIPFVLCILYGGYLSIQGQITPGSLLAFIQMMNYIVEPAQTIPALISGTKGCMGAIRHFFSMLDEDTEEDAGKDYNISGETIALEFSDVTFSYDGESNVLEGLSFRVPAGKTTAFVGQSGSGKSTLVKLICGFYRPQNGNISMFGYDLDYWRLTAARDQIAVVSQDTFLFPASVAENISYGKPGAYFDEIFNAAKTANAHNFILELPEGYETVAGERGVRLSGGQRQRISIARAVLKDAPLLILDEPTSALDTQSEAVVQEALEKVVKGRTALVIAHRLTTIRNADLIYVLDGGSIAESGTHRTLMERGGIYRRLYLRQTINTQVEIEERKECVI